MTFVKLRLSRWPPLPPCCSLQCPLLRPLPKKARSSAKA